MGVAILVLGKSGSGKSTSLRNFDAGEVGIFNVLGKPLPFKGGAKFPQALRPSYGTIINSLQQNKLNAYVLDDSTYLMQNENFMRSRETGYGKFTEMALHFQELINAALATDEDTIVYFLHHVEDGADGTEKVKTIGKMLDERYCIEGACPVVIDCVVRDGEHVFVTKNDGTNLAKAPMGSLPDIMDNDLKKADTMLRDYWGMARLNDKKAKKAGKEKANA